VSLINSILKLFNKSIKIISFTIIKEIIFSMKKIILLNILIFSINTYAQQDSLLLKKPSENRFRVATKVIKNNILSIPSDFSEMGQIISNDWKKTATWAGSILGLVCIDKYTTGFLHDHIEPAIDYQLPSIGINNNRLPWLSGEDAYISYPLIGLYAGSIITNNKRGQIAAGNAFKSLMYSYVISHITLKTLFARNRPHRNINDDLPIEMDYHTRNNWEFGYFHPVEFGAQKPTGSKGSGFPSLHATAFFAVAKVIQMEYDNYWIPYSFITAVFMSNIKGHDHWVSDLVAGGLIGTIIGKAVVTNSRKQHEKKENSLDKSLRKRKIEKKIIPQISKNTAALHIVATF